MRNRLVGTITPHPIEARNDWKKVFKQNLCRSFSVNLVRVPALANTWPWIPASLKTLNGRSNERSANAETATSPPTASLSEAALESPSSLSLVCLRSSEGPSPLDENPSNELGPPPKEQTGDVLPPMKNLSGKDEGLSKYPWPQGKITPPDIPTLSAAR
uniref:Uncharacterized protein n=1 Tax=Opuntia streptacantha TaxID=393608 RepID=A0A7C9EKU2_OPUST